MITVKKIMVNQKLNFQYKSSSLIIKIYKGKQMNVSSIFKDTCKKI